MGLNLIFFHFKKRSEIITKNNVVATPDLVVEVLSENTAVIDRNRKKQLYEKYGVKEYWIADPEKAAIEQYILQNDILELDGEYTITDTLSSKIIENFSVSLSKVFTS